MSHYSSPRTPHDRDAARRADELRAVAQDDTRCPGREATTRPRLSLVLHPLRSTPRARGSH